MADEGSDYGSEMSDEDMGGDSSSGEEIKEIPLKKLAEKSSSKRAKKQSAAEDILNELYGEEDQGSDSDEEAPKPKTKKPAFAEAEVDESDEDQSADDDDDVDSEEAAR